MKQPINNKGFTLIEVLVVAAIMGLVMVSVYSLFLHSQRTASTSEEIVDAQQNLRVALDSLVSDIRMAGFLVDSGTGPIDTAPASLASGATLVLNAPVSSSAFARCIGNVEISAGNTGTIRVDDLMGSGFVSGDSIMIVNPVTLVVAGTVTIVADDDNGTADEADDVIGVDGDELTVSSDAAITVSARDMLLRVAADDDTFPVTITYSLADDPLSSDAGMLLLQRSINGKAPVTVASNISAINLDYLDQAGADSSASLDQVQSVRVSITTKTEDNQIGQNKSRQLQTVVKIRNIDAE